LTGPSQGFNQILIQGTLHGRNLSSAVANTCGVDVQLSRLEFREILSHIKDSVDPDVRRKVELGAEVVEADPLVTIIIPGRGELIVRESELTALYKRPEQIVSVAQPPVKETPSGFTPIPLDKRLIEQGMTQADVDALNAYRKQEYEIAEHIRATRRPITVDVVGNYPKAPPDAIDFAEPDNAKGLGVEPLMPIGTKNRVGDECVAHTADGKPAFRCNAGHGYTENPYVAGCPRCFSGGMSSAMTRDTSGDVQGEESF
jgi:hypothetical protein